LTHLEKIKEGSSPISIDQISNVPSSRPTIMSVRPSFVMSHVHMQLMPPRRRAFGIDQPCCIPSLPSGPFTKPTSPTIPDSVP